MLSLERRGGFLMGLGLGAGIWLLSPLVTGRREPWDAEGLYYLAALFGSGVLGGLLAPHAWLSVAVGIFVGQTLVLVTGVIRDPASGGLWPLGLVFLAFYSVVALLGAGLGAAAQPLTRRFLNSHRARRP
jgi:hypothetical protein